jgi:hypothetical protein
MIRDQVELIMCACREETIFSMSSLFMHVYFITAFYDDFKSLSLEKQFID